MIDNFKADPNIYGRDKRNIPIIKTLKLFSGRADQIEKPTVKKKKKKKRVLENFFSNLNF